MPPLFVVMSCLRTTNSIDSTRNQDQSLAVMNTGWCVDGKSSGRGSLSARTHLSNEMAFIEAYNLLGGCTSLAFRVDAVTQGRDTHDFAKGLGHVVVTMDGAVYSLVPLDKGRRCMCRRLKTVG